MPLYAYIAAIFTLLLSACANTSQNSLFTSDLEQTQRSLHHHVEQLTRQLLLTSSDELTLGQSVAVGTILPITELSGKNRPPANVLGQQLQESLVTLAAQSGLDVIEFKTTKTIHMTDDQDVMLTRTLKDLDLTLDANYFLTGTYYSQGQSVVVNIRLIDVSSRKVVAAATDTIPIGMMWAGSTPSTSNQAGSLYQGIY
ncbi:hypothetical protein A3762_09680 [Oleiphilus sp. HI0125]|uniref:FlgO family outer membrane protein n=2 Tax=unclassified Oleiphilus TaxID=2631174 RepID=UPI0007C2300B|nr:FlgO family outer membrane protein [Oleiphilus sp. HI0125]KZZ56023.1 hypothetical protein A3762_21165 [Oleiphilus sp. HI0125]KZZ57612.1 hypothetical protein A3762_09680 [Oleiphilus sp. HI0125]